MTQETTTPSQDEQAPTIHWPCWTLGIWRGQGLDRYAVPLRPFPPDLAERLHSYLVIQLTHTQSQRHQLIPVTAFVDPAYLGGGKHLGEPGRMNWMALMPEVDETQISAQQFRDLTELFERQLRELVEFLNGQLLGSGWRCDWVDMILKETIEDDGKGIYEHVTRRRGYTFPNLSAAEAGFAKDEDFILG